MITDLNTGTPRPHHLSGAACSSSNYCPSARPLPAITDTFGMKTTHRDFSVASGTAKHRNTLGGFQPAAERGDSRPAPLVRLPRLEITEGAGSGVSPGPARRRPPGRSCRISRPHGPRAKGSAGLRISRPAFCAGLRDALDGTGPSAVPLRGGGQLKESVLAGVARELRARTRQPVPRRS